DSSTPAPQSKRPFTNEVTVAANACLRRFRLPNTGAGPVKDRRMSQFSFRASRPSRYRHFGFPEKGPEKVDLNRRFSESHRTSDSKLRALPRMLKNSG